MKKKILFVITKSNWGGAQRYVYNLSMALNKDIFDVSVALGGTGTSRSTPGELAVRLESINIPTFYIPAFARNISILSDIQAVGELYQIYKKEKPDIVHLNSSKAGGVGALAARLAGVKNIIFTSHGLAWDEDRNFVARTVIQSFSWITFLLCHKVIVIARDNYDRAKSLPFCSQKIILIHSGLPPLQFETRERARLSLALSVGLAEDADVFWIGTIAELTHNKGLSYLIDAVSELAASAVSASGSTTNNTLGSIPFHVFIIGGGEQEQNLKQQIIVRGLQDRVHLVGFVPDAYRYNKAFDLITLTSVKEGLPTVLLEAGQAGVAVTSSDISGARDIIEDGKTGLLMQTKNSRDIATKISTVMHDSPLRNQLADALKQKVAKEFSIKRMVEQTEKLY